MPIFPPTAQDLETFKSLSTAANVAAFLTTSQERLAFHLYSRNRPKYHRFTIAKKSGGVRAIAAPPPVLRAFQRKLLSCVTAWVPPKPNAHGFTIGRSVRTNAADHVGARLLLNVDLADFFPSINFGRVYGLFKSHPFDFPPPVAAILAQICCNGNELPQGAPTSPIISNLICRGLDRDLTRFASRFKCRYSRYCDDLTLSTSAVSFPPEVAVAPAPMMPPSIGESLLAILAHHGFQPNHKKTRVRRRSERQEVTGVIVNQKINTPREFVRNIRSILHDCESRGLTAADDRFQQLIDKKQRRRGGPPPLIRHLNGKLAFLGMIRGTGDPLYVRLAVRARRATGITEKPIAMRGDSARANDGLVEAVWIILGLDVRGEATVQGTAFSLAGVGIVTARHVFEKEACPRYELRPAYAPSTRYPVTSIRQHPDVDIAVLGSDAPRFAALCHDGSQQQVGAPVTIAGYPTWRESTQDHLLIARGAVIQMKNVKGIEYLLIDQDIRGGNSGGPLLSASGDVVGVCVYGSDSSIAPNSATSIKHIDQVLSQQPTAPFPS